MKMACRMQTRQSVPSGPLISEQYIDSWFLSWQDAFEMRLASICAHIYIYIYSKLKLKDSPEEEVSTRSEMRKY